VLWQRRDDVVPEEAGIWRLDILLPSSTEEGRALARDGGPTPVPGWCDPRLRKAPNTCFVSTILKLTKRLNDASWHFPQTTPVPPRDRCRCAAHPLLNSGRELTTTSARSFVRWNDGLERIRIELGLKDAP
jgi:hypothetical protein